MKLFDVYFRTVCALDGNWRGTITPHVTISAEGKVDAEKDAIRVVKDRYHVVGTLTVVQVEEITPGFELLLGNENQYQGDYGDAWIKYVEEVAKAAHQ
jgi:hypothetical protein